MFNFLAHLFNTSMDMRTRTAKPQAAKATREVGTRPDRRQAILLAAEKLFSLNSYHAVTIRQIAQEADVPLALVGYYFGQKHELFHAIFEHWSQTIEERLAALAAVDHDPRRPDTVSRIIEAFVGPVLKLRASAEGEYYALLVARELHHATAETDRVLRAYFDPLACAFIDALQTALPHASRGQVAWCYQFALGALLHHLSDTRVERLSLGANRAGDPAASPLLVNFIVGGLRAALPAPRARLQRSRSPAASLVRSPSKTTSRRPA